jgi:hypothetical protein
LDTLPELQKKDSSNLIQDAHKLQALKELRARERLLKEERKCSILAIIEENEP